jgi:hypothetical protein
MSKAQTRRAPDHRGAHAGRRRTSTSGPIGRRTAIGILAGLGATGLYFAVPGLRPALLGQPARTFPAWVYSSPRGGEAYAAAYSDLDLMDTLPCFCGCMAFKTDPHKSLRTCFEQPSGKIEPHGAFCGTCQGEAIDAIALARLGVSRAETHDRIVAAYGPDSH